jgi:hypothetical protein
MTIRASWRCSRGQTPAEPFYAEPEPDLDAGNGHQGTAAGLPMWLPVDLEGERKAADAAQGMHPGVQLQQPTPAAAVGLVPVELQVRVPACGNLGVAGRQVWLGRRRPAIPSRCGWTGPPCTSAMPGGC